MGEKTAITMIYWNTTPGAEFRIAVPNQYGLSVLDVEGLTLRFEVKNDVGLWVVSSGALAIDSITPNWISTDVTNPQDLAADAYPPQGEYTYRAILWDEEHSREVRDLSAGLMIFGTYTAEHDQYNKPTTYEQYD